jgi:predicted negative regulator of RcsB-dependent stress response
MEKNQHSPLPWEKTHSVIFSSYVKVASCRDFSEDLSKANAEFIVKACNNHYQLLEALKEAVSLVDAHYPKQAEKLLEVIKQAEG